MEHQHSQFALINFDQTNLLLPQREVAVIEMIDTVELNTDNSEKNAIGQFQNDLGRWPVFSMSSDLTTREMIMDVDRYCVCLQHEDIGQFGLICTAVSAFHIDTREMLQSDIATVMLVATNPITQLAYHENRLYLKTNVVRLYHYLIEVPCFGQ